MNGVPMDQKSLTEEDFEEELLTSLMKETQVLFVFVSASLSLALDASRLTHKQSIQYCRSSI